MLGYLTFLPNTSHLFLLWSFYIPLTDISLVLEHASTCKTLASVVISQTPKHVWLQYDIKSPRLFGLICAQNSIGGLVLYNGLNSTKSPQLFHFIWVKICSHIHLCPLPNYLLQTLQIYLDFTWSFTLSKSELLYSVSLIKHICFSYSFLLFYVSKAGDCFVIASLIID